MKVLTHCAFDPALDALPALSVDAASCARIASDERFVPALAALVDPLPIVRCESAPAVSSLYIELASGQGCVGVCIDRHDHAGIASAWSALTQEGAPTLACRILDALLEPWSQALPFPFNAWRVHAVQERPSGPCDPQPGIALRVGALTLNLIHLDDRMARSLQRAMNGVAPPRWMDLTLTLPGHMRLLTRRYPQSQLSALSTGDVLLVGPGLHLESTLRHGIGRFLRTLVHVDFDDRIVRALSPPLMEDEHPQTLAEEHELSMSMETLQVPVSFEIDTARLALHELSAIAPGSIIQLDAPLAEARVNLLCHGQLIGTGQLVAVGDNLGVRIAKMHWKRDDPQD